MKSRILGLAMIPQASILDGTDGGSAGIGKYWLDG
jgi:hypothetical protein